jgi:hypothetical protein
LIVKRNLPELKYDVLEKEGVTDAHKYRIALLATAGHFTEYVTDLM